MVQARDCATDGGAAPPDKAVPDVPGGRAGGLLSCGISAIWGLHLPWK
ncbi:hypothetical protein ACFWUQ_27125 [Streptomyces sp. NPDC058662]